MLAPRVIPCLLVKDKGLVKTIKFKDPKYVGDPINAVKIFNEKMVDELIVLDIDATLEGREPDYSLIENLASECRMPLCYGGGVSTVKQVKKILGLGVEKVALSSAAVKDPNMITAIAEQVGRQSIVVVLDVKKRSLSSKYDIYTHGGKIKHNESLIDFVKKLVHLGVGEIVINNIDKDGTMTGYDLKLAEKLKSVLTVPMTMLGGAGALNDMQALFEQYGIVGAAAGSLFVFKGKYRAVLISYPSFNEKSALM